jgi:hypothetical protein
MSATDNGHVTRYSDSSYYDFVCVKCGATDSDSGPSLSDPCPVRDTLEDKVRRLHKSLIRSVDHDTIQMTNPYLAISDRRYYASRAEALNEVLQQLDDLLGDGG